MAAFNFPEPPVENGTEVTNSHTGVTYRYDLANDCWTIVNTNLVTDIDSQISGLSGEISRIDSEIAAALTERDEMIDSAIAYNDSQDERLNALEASVNDDVVVDLSNYYTKDEVEAINNSLQAQIDDLVVEKGPAAEYTLNDVGIQVGIRDGDFFIDNTVAKSVQFIALAPVDNNGNLRPYGELDDVIELIGLNNKSYRYKITTAGEGIAGVDFITADDPDDLLMPGTTFTVYIYQQNQDKASVQYVDEKHAEALAYTDEAVAGLGLASLATTDLETEIDQNEEQLQALSTALLNAQDKIETLQGLDIEDALSALNQAQQDIIELKSKVNTLELTSFLILE